MSVRTFQTGHSHRGRERRGLFYLTIIVGALCLLLLQCVAGAEIRCEREPNSRLAASFR